ncbi:hypothetical protein [Leptolyngbya sp. FACHB-16]|uniref:hypothetical protein n=1 Tax=unclassified Leptolyngbya TaxID=2650499 RepID=UPI0016884DC7|nr:hypothetical protein [Leptolyngbya sp. FACHB-16]MBD2157865.1 hypothetical protein [Leptolyngbya sp. FACHB-16]
MVAEFTDSKDAYNILKKALEAVSRKQTDGELVGDNDKWLVDLFKRATASSDKEAEHKISALQFLDQILRSSVSTPFPSNSYIAADEALGRLVNEIRGYQDLTERFFSDLRRLTSKDQQLEQKAVETRNNLFTKLSQVQQWLIERKEGTNPSEFGACTNQFLSRIQSNPRALSLTQQLFKNQQLELAESDLRTLIDVWGDVVSTFVEDAQDTDKDDSLKLGNPETIAQYLCIHNRLETLYARLSTNISLVN